MDSYKSKRISYALVITKIGRSIRIYKSNFYVTNVIAGTLQALLRTLPDIFEAQCSQKVHDALFVLVRYSSGGLKEILVGQ